MPTGADQPFHIGLHQQHHIPGRYPWLSSLIE
jgi:hypothetical protein